MAIMHLVVVNVLPAILPGMSTSKSKVSTNSKYLREGVKINLKKLPLP